MELRTAHVVVLSAPTGLPFGVGLCAINATHTVLSLHVRPNLLRNRRPIHQYFHIFYIAKPNQEWRIPICLQLPASSLKTCAESLVHCRIWRTAIMLWKMPLLYLFLLVFHQLRSVLEGRCKFSFCNLSSRLVGSLRLISVVSLLLGC